MLTEHGALGPLETAEQRESVSLALLERLSPAERAVFVLREAFDYSYREIAEVLELSEAYCRQLRKRTGDRIGDGRRRFRADQRRWRRLVERFLHAAQRGDLRALEEMLTADVTAWSNGGGKVSAARRPEAGAVRVARLYAGMFTRRGSVALLVAEVNGEPAIVGMDGAEARGVLAIDVVEGRITALRAVANPDKLRFVARQSSGLSHLGELSRLYG